MEWISVEEKLPKITDGEVIVTIKHPAHNMSLVKMSTYNHHSRRWNVRYGWKVTHWKPKPKLPETIWKNSK